MRLKNLKRETKTTVAIRNENEYFLLMDLLEKAGYKWSTGDRPTEFNSEPEFYGCGNVVLYPKCKIMTYGYLICGKPIRKMVKFEVGDKVKIREDLEMRISSINTRQSMSRYTGSIQKIEELYPNHSYKLYNCPFLLPKKWLDIAIEEGSDSDKVDWSKVEVDTPILVRYDEADEWTKRYFAKFEDGHVFAWDCGATSWSASGSFFVSPWKCAKLAGKE